MGTQLGELMRKYQAIARSGEPAKCAEHMAGATVQEEGFRTEGRFGRHLVLIDEPTSFGGTDSAANPAELLLAGLGASLSVTLRCHAALLGLQLFAEHGFTAALDEGKLARRFRFCTGGEMADFRAIGLLDEPPGVPAGNPEQANPSRYLLWQHPLLGLFDTNICGRELGAHYARLGEEMAACATRGITSAPRRALRSPAAPAPVPSRPRGRRPRGS